jgi:hypothetical protein
MKRSVCVEFVQVSHFFTESHNASNHQTTTSSNNAGTHQQLAPTMQAITQRLAQTMQAITQRLAQTMQAIINGLLNNAHTRKEDGVAQCAVIYRQQCFFGGST